MARTRGTHLNQPPLPLPPTAPIPRNNNRHPATFQRPDSWFPTLFGFMVGGLLMGIFYYLLMREKELSLGLSGNLQTSLIPTDTNLPGFAPRVVSTDLELWQTMGAQPDQIESFKASCDAVARTLYELLPCVISWQVLSALFGNDSKVQVHLMPTEVLAHKTNGARGGYYNSTGEVIGIVADNYTLAAPSLFAPLLRNEFHHRSMHASNMKFRNTSNSAPFLNNEGYIDRKLLQQLNDALKKVDTRFKWLAELLDSPQLTPAQQKQLNEVENILKMGYQPQRYLIQVSSVEYKRLKKIGQKNGQNDEWVIPAGTKINDVSIPHAYVVKETTPHGKQWLLTYSYYGKSLADALKKDYYGVFFGSTERDAMYTNLPPAAWIAEKASMVDSLPPVVKQLFATEFCKYMDSYARIDGYCAAPMLSNNQICKL